METQTCPKCGFQREPKALECPVCGVVYAKFERGAPARPLPAGAGPAAESVRELEQTPYAAPPPLPANPYATPQANLSLPGPPPLPQGTFQGLWRSGDELVFYKGYPLPGRCIVCNRETSYWWRKTLSWVPIWVHFTIVLQLLIYLIIYLSVRKQADVAIPLCQEHEAKRKQNTTLSWVLVIGGLAMMIGCVAAADIPRLVLAIFLLGLASLITGAVLSVKGNVVRPAKIDNTYVWLKKVSPEFLATLPQAPAGL